MVVTAGIYSASIDLQIPGQYVVISMNIKFPNTCVVFPSNLARSEWMVTCGIMFFSTASWNKGGGGKSIARNRNGETEALESKQILLSFQNEVRN